MNKAFPYLIALLLAAPPILSAAESKAELPNLVFILADDKY